MPDAQLLVRGAADDDDGLSMMKRAGEICEEEEREFEMMRVKEFESERVDEESERRGGIMMGKRREGERETERLMANTLCDILSLRHTLLPKNVEEPFFFFPERVSEREMRIKGVRTVLSHLQTAKVPFSSHDSSKMNLKSAPFKTYSHLVQIVQLTF